MADLFLPSTSVELKESNAFDVFPVFDFRIDEPVQQFLFNESEKLLLIPTSSTDRIWDLKSKRDLCCRRWNSSQGRRWIQHPFKRELLTWIDPSTVRTYSWKELEHADPIKTPTGGARPIKPHRIPRLSRQLGRLDKQQTVYRLPIWRRPHKHAIIKRPASRNSFYF